MFKILDEACIPQRATKYSAMVDLFAREDVIIGAGETKIVPLGVKVDLDLIDRELLGINACKNDIVCMQIWERFLRSHYIEVAIRSSLGAKGLIMPNGIGIIDLDYPGEIGLIVHNPMTKGSVLKELYQTFHEFFRSKKDISLQEKDQHTINKGDKVAQCTLKEHKGYLMGYESDIVREGGFGSTGL